MSEQIENYLILKGISERFNKIAGEMSDEEIKRIITRTMQEKLEKLIFVGQLDEIISDYLEDNKDEIAYILKKSITDKLNK